MVVVAASRTGTTRWLSLVASAKRRAQRDGLTHCPLCGTLLNYARGRTPSSAEGDHIVPYSRGGADTLDNIRIICRRCNQRRGNGMRRPRPRPSSAARVATAATTHSDVW